MNAEIINGITSIKEGDTLTDFVIQLTDGNGTAVNLTGKTVKVLLGNASGKILEKTATLMTETGKISFGFDPGDVTGNGAMFLEIHVITGTEKRIFPANGYINLKIDKNLNAVGTVVTTVTLDYFQAQINSLQASVNTALSDLAAARTAQDARFVVYEAQYNNMLNLAANVNAALGNLANTANEYIMRAALGADVTHTFTENYVGKVQGSTVVNPHFAGSSTGASALVLPSGSWSEVNAAAITSMSTINGVGATYTTALTAGLVAQLRMSFNLIEAVQRKYNIILNGSTADKVAWLKQNITLLNFDYTGRGTGAAGNLVTLKPFSVLANVWGSFDSGGSPSSSSASITTLSGGITSSMANFIDANGYFHVLAYANAASASVASSVITDYFELDITVRTAFENQTPVEYRINVLDPPVKTGLLPYVIGGDVTTNTTRLKAMLAYLNTQGYGNLYFPNTGIEGIGTGRPYYINDVLLMNYTVDMAIPITIEGEDYGSYIQQMDDTKRVFDINGVNNVRDFRIKNLTIRGGTYGIRIRWGAYVYIEDVNIRGSKTACMRFEVTFGFCSNVWMFHTSSRLVESSGNGHIRWDACTFGEDAGGFYLEDTEMSFNNCKFLQLKTFDVATTETGIGGADGVTGTKTRAIFYTLFNVNVWFTDCDFIHNETQSYLFYFTNSPNLYQFVNCKFDVGAGTSLFAFRNPSVYTFKTGLVLNSCEINGTCELYSYALSDAIRHLKIVNSIMPLATQIENDPNSAQLYEIGDGCVFT